MKISKRLRGFILFYTVGLAVIYVGALRMESLNKTQIEDTKIVYYVNE